MTNRGRGQQIGIEASGAVLHDFEMARRLARLRKVDGLIVTSLKPLVS